MQPGTPYSGRMVDLAQALAEFFVGIVVGSTGVGGGLLMTICNLHGHLSLVRIAGERRCPGADFPGISSLPTI
jgi:uncharacterized membrane protein YfcA